MDEILRELEEKSIFILRETKARFRKPAILWSTGKDSTVVLELSRRAFFGRIPWPAIHIDNGIDFPETYEFRERLSRLWNFKVIVARSKIKDDKISGISCCGANKTEALKKVMQERNIDALIVSIRRDEHGIRAKERYFSPRDKEFQWHYENQPLEIWGAFSVPHDSDHIRVHPILHWTELDVWRYIKLQNIPVNPLYFSRNGKRYRSLGCTKCTVAIPSTASSVDEIIKELETSDISERSGRSQDKEREYTMQRLRSLGYM